MRSSQPGGSRLSTALRAPDGRLTPLTGSRQQLSESAQRDGACLSSLSIRPAPGGYLAYLANLCAARDGSHCIGHRRPPPSRRIQPCGPIRLRGEAVWRETGSKRAVLVETQGGSVCSGCVDCRMAAVAGWHFRGSWGPRSADPHRRSIPITGGRDVRAAFALGAELAIAEANPRRGPRRKLEMDFQDNRCNPRGGQERHQMLAERSTSPLRRACSSAAPGHHAAGERRHPVRGGHASDVDRGAIRRRQQGDLKVNPRMAACWTARHRLDKDGRPAASPFSARYGLRAAPGRRGWSRAEER